MIRAELKLTIEDAAKRCGLKTATWATWEQGVRPRDFQSVVNRIHVNLGTDREWLAWGGVLEPQNLKSLTRADRHLAAVSDPEGQLSMDLIMADVPRPHLALVPDLEPVD